jgi:hypothetical protein
MQKEYSCNQCYFLEKENHYLLCRRWSTADNKIKVIAPDLQTCGKEDVGRFTGGFINKLQKEREEKLKSIGI